MNYLHNDAFDTSNPVLINTLSDHNAPQSLNQGSFLIDYLYSSVENRPGVLDYVRQNYHQFLLCRWGNYLSFYYDYIYLKNICQKQFSLSRNWFTLFFINHKKSVSGLTRRYNPHVSKVGHKFNPISRFFRKTLSLDKSTQPTLPSNLNYVFNTSFQLYHHLFFNNRLKITTPLIRVRPYRFITYIYNDAKYSLKIRKSTLNFRFFKRSWFLSFLAKLDKRVCIVSKTKTHSFNVHNKLPINRKEPLSRFKKKMYLLPRQYAFLNTNIKPNFKSNKPIKSLLLKRSLSFYRRNLRKFNVQNYALYLKSKSYKLVRKFRTDRGRARNFIISYLAKLNEGLFVNPNRFYIASSKGLTGGLSKVPSFPTTVKLSHEKGNVRGVRRSKPRVITGHHKSTLKLFKTSVISKLLTSDVFSSSLYRFFFTWGVKRFLSVSRKKRTLFKLKSIFRKYKTPLFFKLYREMSQTSRRREGITTLILSFRKTNKMIRRWPLDALNTTSTQTMKPLRMFFSTASFDRKFNGYTSKYYRRFNKKLLLGLKKQLNSVDITSDDVQNPPFSPAQIIKSYLVYANRRGFFSTRLLRLKKHLRSFSKWSKNLVQKSNTWVINNPLALNTFSTLKNTHRLTNEVYKVKLSTSGKVFLKNIRSGVLRSALSTFSKLPNLTKPLFVGEFYHRSLLTHSGVNYKNPKGYFLLSRYNTPFILSNTGFLFINSFTDSVNNHARTRMNKYRFSFFYKNDIKRFYLRKPGKLKLISSFLSPKGFFQTPYLSFLKYNRTSNSLLKESTDGTGYTIAGAHYKNRLLNPIPRHYSPDFTSPYEFEIRIKRIRFKPGYSRIWRKSREAINFSLNLRLRYQHRLTVCLARLARIRRESELHFHELQLFRLVLHSKLATDLRSSFLMIQNGLIYLNGSVSTNPNTFLVSGDFIQAVVSLKFYIVYRWLMNWGVRNKLRITKFSQSKQNQSRLDLSKQKSDHIPDWVFLAGVKNFDIPKYLEVDYFTLSSFILYEPFLLNDFNPLTILESRSTILNMYNWKYIN